MAGVPFMVRVITWAALASDPSFFFDLPEAPIVEGRAEGAPSKPEGIEGAVNSVHFVDDTILYTAGVAGVLRWNLEPGTHERVFAAEPGTEVTMEMSDKSRPAIIKGDKDYVYVVMPIHVLE